MPKMVDCPRCGGCPEMDDEGCYYACYYCGDAGQILESVALAEEQERIDMIEKFAPRALGIFIRPMTSEYDWHEEDEIALFKPGHRLFTRLIPAEITKPSAAEAFFDDLPF